MFVWFFLKEKKRKENSENLYEARGSMEDGW